ncbi:MAG: MBL fold metallo-hydrolase [Candidatus Abyssubacteria bacterium]
MKLTFLGTRGYIDARTPKHYMHTSTMVSYHDTDVLIDCGEDWLDKIQELKPQAIFITHGHPDHAWGLKYGAPAPVFATEETWEENIKRFEIPEKDRHVVRLREPTEINGITFEAFSVVHSTRAPAVGYRITAGEVAIFYVPDLVYIHEREEALKNAKVYVGDGATITRSMVRKPGDQLIGHTPVRTQLTWCQKEGVPKMIVTHCGSEIVEGNERKIGAKIRTLAEERGVEVEVAYDGMEVVLR